MKLFKIVVLLVATMLAMPALAADKGADKGQANMDILRDKIKADKKLVVAGNMQLTDAEAKGFWPIYDAYQKDLGAINDRILKTVAAYADAYNKGPVPNDVAMKLLNEAIAIEDDEVKLKRAYIPKLEKVIPGNKVARYMQIENKIRALVRMELAANIPLTY